ncbi:600_t:CDS:2 [Acaulospora morrowiae]|uniref:600_t:CDS:1 n=1 Tax=Acaulospora morrowiae TaxID=94023 RepID=A0A9N8VJU9_9GLOM|nr:600_t:CDS:2 [Acaulospora morrowiae]
MIKNLYEKQCDILKTYFNNLSSKVALTTDIWTACTNQAYMSITLHWIDDNWQMHRILLDLIPLHERHTGTNLANIIDTIISDFNLGKKIMAITTDNAYNMNAFGQKFAQLLSTKYNNTIFRRIRCAAHILNLIVKDGLKEAKVPVKKIREFSITIRSSQCLLEDLKEIFKMKKRPFLVPETDVSTHWNSTYLMIKKMHKIRDITKILIASHKELKDIYPNEEDWKELNMLTILLEPIFEATCIISASSHPTLGDLRMVLVVIADILKEAQQENNTIIKRVVDKMEKKLNKYWRELKSAFHEAVILDPNSKLASFKDEEKCEA